MKHIACVSGSVPAGANQFQDILCEVAHSTALILQAKGGNIPFVTYLDGKCTITPVTAQEISPYGPI
jgi:hypothetical protein